ncbi:MAG: acyl-CoA/acyl-ACP dehydrogenase [Alphaproteobacteria bacterium]|nr:acyl-CoA/acyl-ACP dehydrogenase [Alphaproteobacteria bacterium]
MTHSLTEEQRLLIDTARGFARQSVEPLAAQIDREESTPQSLIDKAAELGFFGLCIPAAYGGSGASLTDGCLVLEEIAKASPSFAGLLSVQMILCPWTVLRHGNPEQKQRLLPASASGERLMAYSQTEPAGAGNTAFHQTKLRADGNSWRLNGAKLFCTQGSAKTYLVWCRTLRDGQEGYGLVIVEQEAPGFQVAPYEEKLGWRGTNTGPISFQDILITPENVLGDLLTASTTHGPINQASFMGHAATSVGCAQGMFEKTLEYVKGRSLYGAPMHVLSPVSHYLAKVHNKIEACRALLYSATAQYDDGAMQKPMGSVCKDFICETAFECCNTLLQLWGGSGIMNSTGINRYFRDARTKLIAEGATEMHTSMVSADVLDLRAPVLQS